MSEHRILQHPILSPQLQREEIEFYFKDKLMRALKGEMISTALFANGERSFGKHHKDGAEQGIFCANGQCAQCLVMANQEPVKACVTEIKAGMRIYPMNELPELVPDDDPVDVKYYPPEIECEVFIMGGGPAGLCAAVELAQKNVKVIVADDKNELGGKLSLQTHNFFGSASDCYAGIRGMDIGHILTEEVKKHSCIEVWTDSPVVGAFSDKRIGVLKKGRYVLVKPDRFLVAAGAREKALAFPGCDLPGVYGAGAFQTLVNRDLVRAAEKLFVIGGGNVGLIAAYHALQAGIDVVGLVEALPQCGGYKVHLDKIKRLGVPIWNCHTVLRVEGNKKVERVIIAEVDKEFNILPGTEGAFDVDTVLVAAGLSPVNEMYKAAQEFGIPTYAAGDADIIAEASAAIFGGKIVGRKILQDMGFDVEAPPEWGDIAEVLRSKPGATDLVLDFEPGNNKIYPIIRCVQEIPCNPCTTSCHRGSIVIKTENLIGTPQFSGDCAGCGKCVAICPGLAITLVDESIDPTKQKAHVIIPWELPNSFVQVEKEVVTTGFEGEVIGSGRVVKIREKKWQDHRKFVYLEVPFSEAKKVAGIRIREPAQKQPLQTVQELCDEEIIVCRCERVTKKQIKDKIRDGCMDFNALKAELRIGMGPCGGKTCLDLIWKIYQECGQERRKVMPHTYRPFEMEVPLKAFLSETGGEK